MERTLSTGCAHCASGDCWYCERGTGTREAANGEELPVCCYGRVFITPVLRNPQYSAPGSAGSPDFRPNEGWIEGARS